MLIDTSDIVELKVKVSDGQLITLYFDHEEDKKVFIDELNTLLKKAFGE